MPAFRILSIDGGGVRGAFAAGLLAYWERQLGQRLCDQFDLITGTSTGAIIASGLASGMPAERVAEFYRHHAPAIFGRAARSIPSLKVPSALQRWLARRGGPRAEVPLEYLFQTRYCPHPLRLALQTAFGATTLGEVANSRLLIPVLNLSLGKTQLLRTPHLPLRQRERDWPMVDILLAATAAPTYFPHKVLPDGLAYADGGLWATCPAWLAFAEAMQIQQLCDRPVCDPRYDTADIEVISVGCGTMHYSLVPPHQSAGILYWSQHAAEVMGTAQVDGTHTPLEFLLGSRYLRIDFPITDPNWQLDNGQIAGLLTELGEHTGERLWPSMAGRLKPRPIRRYEPYPRDTATWRATAL